MERSAKRCLFVSDASEQEFVAAKQAACSSVTR
jgi:hypothetical protein